jgi:GLPGLI family protein
MKIKIFFFTLISNFCFSQNWIKGEYNYVDIINNDTINSVLYTNSKESVFRILDIRKNGFSSNNGSFKISHTDSLSNFSYSNSEKTYSRITLYTREFVFCDSTLGKLNWILTKRIKKVGNYNCQEAKIKLNGRKYTVWYTTKIPVNMGPLRLNGLPGLIVEVTEDDNIFKIYLKAVTTTENKKDFDFCKDYLINNKKVMSYKEYTNKMIDVMIARKNKLISSASETNVELHFHDSFFTNFLIDVPDNLEKKLSEIPWY